MASIVTDYGQDYFANSLFGKSVSPPSTFWMALLYQPPDFSSTGSNLTEPEVTGGYARVSVANNATNFGPASGGIVANNVVINFGIASADWTAPVTDYAFCDASTAGNVYMSGTLRIPRQVFAGDQVTFGVGLLMMSVSSIQQIIVGT